MDMKLRLNIARLAAAACACCIAFSAAAEVQPILWKALRPAEQGNRPDRLPGTAATVAQGETLVSAFDGRMIELSGYVLPVDRTGDSVHEFMLVPWSGACSHTAPPPPNQLVHVVLSEPIRIDKVYDTVKITGKLKPGLEKTQLFIMDGVRVLQSGYSMSNATVTRVTSIPDPELGGSPWKFLKN